jgi:GNAT superfamily N-acetyltransferase
MINLTIRNATLEDTTPIAILCGQLGYPTSPEEARDRLTTILDKQDHAMLVAETPIKGLLGWIHVFAKYLPVADPYAEVSGLVVYEPFRSKGVGKALIQAAEEWTLNHGFHTLLIRSNTIRSGAYEFYTHIGYQLKKNQNVFVKGLR